MNDLYEMFYCTSRTFACALKPTGNCHDQPRGCAEWWAPKRHWDEYNEEWTDTAASETSPALL